MFCILAFRTINLLNANLLQLWKKKTLFWKKKISGSVRKKKHFNNFSANPQNINCEVCTTIICVISLCTDFECQLVVANAHCGVLQRCLTDWEMRVVLSKGGQCLLVQRGQLLRLSNEWRHSAFQSRGVSPLVPGEWTPCRVFPSGKQTLRIQKDSDQTHRSKENRAGKHRQGFSVWDGLVCILCSPHKELLCLENPGLFVLLYYHVSLEM